MKFPGLENMDGLTLGLSVIATKSKVKRGVIFNKTKD